MKKLLKQLRKKIENDWGKKCKDFCFGCSVCWAHQVLESLESMYSDEDNWDIKKPVRKNKKEEKEIKEFLLESNAIEGVHGEGALEDALRAWNYISDKSFLTPEVILGAHNFLSKNSNPRIAGFWRNCDVWIGGKRKIFISMQLIEEDIKALCNKINQSIKDKEKLTKEEREKFCKDAHINFEFIHPHEDYNGRVGRLIMNWHRSMLGLKILTIHTGDEQFDYYKWFKD